MTPSISERTKSTLLLTAPLLPRGSGSKSEPLRPREYQDLSSTLSQTGRTLEDLLGAEAQEILEDIRIRINSERLSTLLARGLQLAGAIDRWHSRGIWVIGLGDPEYPQELVERLGAAAPPVLYGCGNLALLRVSGLAVVGSRNPSAEAVQFARTVAEEAAHSHVPVVSGGAKGIDASAMRSALQAGGNAVGILAQRLDRAAVAGENREYLVAGQLLLLSPYDPSAGLNVGNAMARNKLIYAFANAALVASADHNRGGTWAGAIEQLQQQAPMPLYVRGDMKDDALSALIKYGAKTWPRRRRHCATGMPSRLHSELCCRNAHPSPSNELIVRSRQSDAVAPRSRMHSSRTAGLSRGHNRATACLAARVLGLGGVGTVIEEARPLPNEAARITTLSQSQIAHELPHGRRLQHHLPGKRSQYSPLLAYQPTQPQQLAARTGG